MDLFFDCVPKKENKTYTVGEALKHIFSTPGFFRTMNLSVRGKVLCKVLCDGRGAATYSFKTLSGPFAVAESVYGPARILLDQRCFYEGPPKPLPGSFELPEESRCKIVVTFGPAPVESDENDFEFI
jgi:hypothetical protein